MSQRHSVLLFGVVLRSKVYNSKNIRIFVTPQSHILNLGYTVWRLLKLGFSSPHSVKELFKEILKYENFYDRWIWFSKFLPIVLYKPDILHLQWARDLEFYYFLKEKFDINLAVSLRGAHVNYTPIVEPRMADIYRRTFSSVDGFHAVSEAIANEAQIYGAKLHKIEVIHSPLPPGFFQSFKPFKKSGNEIFQLVSVGRFHWKKGFSYALDAIHALKNAGYKVEYTVIGSDLVPEDILYHIHQLKLQDHVKYIGSMSQSDLLHNLKTFDALLLPSVEEGIANVVLEAMAVGLPVISTDCGGMAEVVSHKETGWLVESRNAGGIANAIIELNGASEEDLDIIVQNAHDFVKKHFNSENSIHKFIEWYEAIDKN